MEHFAGLDVSVNETSVCIVDDTGKIIREAKVASEPEALFAGGPEMTVTCWRRLRCLRSSELCCCLMACIMLAAYSQKGA